MLTLEKKLYFDTYEEKITKFENDDTEELKVIGTMCLCNTASLNISYISLFMEYVIVNINNYKFEICDLECDLKNEDKNYFIFHNEKYYLDEFMRI